MAADPTNFRIPVEHTAVNLAEDFLLRRSQLFGDISRQPKFFVSRHFTAAEFSLSKSVLFLPNIII